MYEKAIEAFEFSIIVNEDFELAYFDVAEVCMLLGMYQKAAKYLEIAITATYLNKRLKNSFEPTDVYLEIMFNFAYLIQRSIVCYIWRREKQTPNLLIVPERFNCFSTFF